MLERIFAPASIDALFSDAALIAAMARFQMALARAQVDAGLVPAGVADVIVRVCHEMGDPAATDGNPEAVAGGRFDAARLYGPSRATGSLAGAFLRALGEQVAVVDADAQRYLGLGVTHQDLLDSALTLQCKEAGRRVLDSLERTGTVLARLAAEHRHTVMMGRAMLQPVAAITFGWKAAQWLDPLARCRRHLRAALLDAAVVQLGGPAGNRTGLTPDPAQVEPTAQRVADALGLQLPPSGWAPSRDRFVRLGSELALVCGQIGKIGQDLALLSQAEVAEVEEPVAAGRHASSSFLAFPSGALLMREASLRAPGLVATLLGSQPLEHEQGLASWQSTWWTLRGLFGAAGSALLAAVEALDRLRVDKAAMQANFERHNAALYSEAVVTFLTPRTGEAAARALVVDLCREAVDKRFSLRQILGRDSRISGLMSLSELERLFDPAAQFRASDPQIDQLLAAWQASR